VVIREVWGAAEIFTLGRRVHVRYNAPIQ